MHLRQPKHTKMTPAITKDKPNTENTRHSPNQATTSRPTTRCNGTSVIIEELQDIKDSLEGRKYLEKHSLLCPLGEPPTHISLSTCLHQISAMAGIQKPVLNAIRSVAFLLEEIEETQISTTVKEALDNQIMEFASDIKLLIEDAKDKISHHLKTTEDHTAKEATSTLNPCRQNTTTYASVLINPPAHANPKIAAREGIKARQFLIEGVKNSNFAHLDNTQIKTELNKILSELELPSSRIQSITSTKNGRTTIEMNTDEAAVWLAKTDNQTKICEKIGNGTKFRARTFNIIAFNVPLAIETNNNEHRLEICEANDLDPNTINSIKWAKSINRRSPNQLMAHLILTINNTNSANRAITNGLKICNKCCHVEKVKRELPGMEPPC